MNVIEKQAQLGRELFEINSGALRRMAELSTEEFQQFVSVNQEFATKLPEVKDIAGFVELQREYGQTMWSHMQKTLEVRGDLVREAVESASEAMRGAFSEAASEAANEAGKVAEEVAKTAKASAKKAA